MTPSRSVDAAQILRLGRETFAQEAAALETIGAGLGDSFVQTVRALLDCEGRVLVTGLGKSGNVAHKIAASLTSTGTPSHFIHPVEAAHGDLGLVRQSDVLLAISRSGNNAEVTRLVQTCRHFRVTTVAITGGVDSDLAHACDIVLPVPVAHEADPLNLAPTTSATAALVMGDAIVVALLTLKGFTRDDFAVFHPSGVLGRSLLVRVEDLMHRGPELPVVTTDMTLRQSLSEIVGKRLGGVCVVDPDGRLAGVCVDGDVKRILLQHDDALDRPITEAMNPSPTTIAPDLLAARALRLMEERPEGPITLLIVVDADRRPVGLLHIHDVLRAGLL